ncbi:MAG: hypothetical protein WAU28_05920 [Candidatus Moraniibacteriota bacterium]
MSLKVLFIPFSLILVLVLSIGYIKPDYDAFLVKGMSVDAAQQQLNQMEQRLGNIKAISGDFASASTEALGGKNADEVLVDQYVPEVVDQERVVDAFNYLAGQSGILVSSITLEKPPVTAIAPKEEAMSSQAILIGGAGTANAGVPLDQMITLKATYPEPKVYQATVALSTDYASFLDLFSRIYHMNRENEVKSFSLKKDAETKDDKGNPLPSDTLSGSLVVSFMYYPGLSTTSMQNIEALPIFNTAKLDTKAIDAIRMKTVSEVLPPLTVSSFSARENPFVQ